MRLALVLALVAATAHAEQRVITLPDAVDLALKVDPLMEAAVVQRDRAKLGVLRSQLDRITFRIDGQLQELWNKSNIGGPALGTCSFAGQSLSTDQGTCNTAGGTFALTGDQAPAFGQGLFNLTAQANIPLFAGFRVDATVKAAQRNQDAAIVQIRRQKRETSLSAARAFWSVRRLEMLRDSAVATLQRLQESEGVASARVKAGLAPQIDKNRAASRRLAQLSTIAEYEGQIEDSVAQFGVALGIIGSYRLEGGFTFPETPPPNPTELIEAARKTRPELEQIKLQLEVQRQQIRIAKSTYYPQLSAFGLFQYGNNQLSVGTGTRDASSVANPFSGLSGSLTVGGVLNMNFFNMLTTYTQTRDAEYEADRLLTEQKRIERVVDADVLVARAKVSRLFGKRQPLVEALAIARDNARILEARYKAGDALVIELLDSQLELSSAEASLVDVEAQLELAWLELRASLGENVGHR